ncbi:helix-turn-helix transcriptional regulator [Yersinia enterocolitica]|uniref:helix-turn-helix domain-containing protein n=1 Tax=Yersinia TaxID=629 RepID=UPI002A14B23B|nr:XRE family transcriptional regulator [Yersinia enterocolitica]EKN6282192.1 XRE family transcriptional regulator [Yersinia enterocolitica]ELY5201958.1 helix-turn-helix transcriptional regulator [Yersinia enterocolitica]ELY5242130.1 helix-turn-helix transcriptional regulator [Yersinia enterocolitica]EMA7649127.1 helix-turn-helix transcriptional regulator [Yersinia enterocolitica]
MKIKRKSFATIVGSRLLVARVQKGFSQNDIQNATGIDRATLSRVENGKQHISLYQLLQILAVLNMGIDALLKDIEVDNDN